MIQQERLDYLYDYITLEDEDLSHLQNGLSERELSRLERLPHLGLVAKTYKLARHNKLEHAYGTYWLSKICLENTRGLIHNKVAFRLASIMHGIGHLPFSYDTEYAVAKLYLVHHETRDWLNGLFDSVVEFTDDESIEFEATNMKSNLEYAKLHSWFAAHKIATSSNKEFKNQLGKSIVNVWLNTNTIDNQLLWELDKIDYVLRDMHYLALGRIELNLIPMLRQFVKDANGQLIRPSILDFIEATHDYLCEQVYFSAERRYLSQVLEKFIFKEVIHGNIRVEELSNKTDDELENSFVRPGTGEIIPVLSDAVRNVNDRKYWQICSIACDCKDKSIVEMERNLAGTNLRAMHNYSEAKGIYIQALPKPYYGDLPPYEWTSSGVSVCIDYDFSLGHPKHAIGALILAERWAPENAYGVELTCREEALRFLTGLEVQPNVDRYDSAVSHIVSKHMPNPETEWDPRLFHSTWKLGKGESIIEELFYSYGVDWPVRHFLAFPEHWSSKVVTDILQDVDRVIARPRKRSNESGDEYQARKGVLLEYSHYLKSILQIRENRIGWVLPSLWLLKENHEQEAEIDVTSICVPRPYAGPVTLELKAVSNNASPDNQNKNRRQLDKVLQRIKVRFGRKVSVVGYFNDIKLFEWP